MVTLSFILSRLNLVLALLPLLTFKRVANLLLAIFYFLIRSSRTVKHPPILILTVTTDCNYSCVMCLRSSREDTDKGKLMDYRNPREMDFEVLEALLREHAAHLCMVRLHGGEPLYYSHIRRLIPLLDELKIPYNIITNGSLLAEDINAQLAGSYCFNVGVSLDAATPATYADLRRPGNLETVLGNIRDLNRAKAEAGSRRPVLGVSMCTFSRNAHEMAAMVLLCRENGIPSLTVNEGWDYDTELISDTDLVGNNTDRVQKEVARARKEAKRLGVNLRVRMPSLAGIRHEGVPRQVPKEKPRDCLNLYASAWILPDFELIGCSSATGGFGNITRNPFAEVWNGAEYGYVRARKCLKSNIVPTECQGCVYTGSFVS